MIAFCGVGFATPFIASAYQMCVLLSSQRLIGDVANEVLTRCNGVTQLEGLGLNAFLVIRLLLFIDGADGGTGSRGE